VCGYFLSSKTLGDRDGVRRATFHRRVVGEKLKSQVLFKMNLLQLHKVFSLELIESYKVLLLFGQQR
jgi:hypothetical protein